MLIVSDISKQSKKMRIEKFLLGLKTWRSPSNLNRKKLMECGWSQTGVGSQMRGSWMQGIKAEIWLKRWGGWLLGKNGGLKKALSYVFLLLLFNNCKRFKHMPVLIRRSRKEHIVTSVFLKITNLWIELGLALLVWRFWWLYCSRVKLWT